jgi:hypothetical protein
MGTYTPPGWPAGVHPPGSEDFESTAAGWLLDVVPPDYRLHGVLRRYPVALATIARYHAKACVEGARQGYRTARIELAGALPPHAIDTVLAAYRKEGARLADTARAVGLVERALRGEVFTPKTDPPATLDRPERAPGGSGPPPQAPGPAGSAPPGPAPREGSRGSSPTGPAPRGGSRGSSPTGPAPREGSRGSSPTGPAPREGSGGSSPPEPAEPGNSSGRGKSDLART